MPVPDRVSLPVGLFPGAGVALTPQEKEALDRQEFLAYQRQRREQATAERDASSNRLRNGVFDFMENTVGVAPEWANRAAGAVDYIPILGDASGGEDVWQDVKAGNWRNAAIGTVATGVGVVPMVGDVASKGLRTVARGADDVVDVARATGNVVEDVNPRAVAGGNGGPEAADWLQEEALAPYNLPPGSKPEYLGAQVNRSRGPIPRYVPAKTPARMARLDVQLADPESALRKQIALDVEAGKKVGGLDWYNTEELRDWFVKEHGEDAGEERWRDFIGMVGATSTGSKVPQNLRNASFYASFPRDQRRRVAERVAKTGEFKGASSITPMAAAVELGYMDPGAYPKKVFKEYGHKQQVNHALNVLSTMDGAYSPVMPEGLTKAQQTAWLQLNPKIKGFGNDLTGDRTNIAADMHFMRMLAMADGSPDFLENGSEMGRKFLDDLEAKNPGLAKGNYIKSRTKDGKTLWSLDAKRAVNDGALDIEHLRNEPGAWASSPGATEYDQFEKLAGKLASELGLTPAQFQAALWMGAGERTGLADTSKGTFMELIRKAGGEQAGRFKKIGKDKSQAQTLQDFVKGGLLRERAPTLDAARPSGPRRTGKGAVAATMPEITPEMLATMGGGAGALMLLNQLAQERQQE